MFFERNRDRLADFVRISQAVGSRPDYIQGSGGNTSVKLQDGKMAIKASGFCLSDIRLKRAYSVVDSAAIRDFFLNSEPEEFENTEAAGSAKVRESVLPIEGLEQLRPSVETGFHSILKTYVLHTHSVYANLAACAVNCREIAQRAFADADYTWGMVPYFDPGANLTYAIRDEIRNVKAQKRKVPSVILMQNHGIVVHDDNRERCLHIHTDANMRLAEQFGVSCDSFPEIKVLEAEPGVYQASVPYLTQEILASGNVEKLLQEQVLYPDQMVFLADTFFMDRDTVEEGQCVAYSNSGKVLMRMDRKKAQTLTETLTAVMFIISHIQKAGYPLSTMGDTAKHFIANWESEKYRKTLMGR